MNGNLPEAMAVRLAEICLVMGLDDTDEDLLWRYVAGLQNGHRHLPRPIAEVLEQKSEFDPVLIMGYGWVATYPDRFYTPGRSKKARWGFGLKARGQMNTHDTGTYARSESEFREELLQRVRRQCFELWMDEVTAVLRPDGRNWEPPTDLDVQVELRLEAFSLSEKLRQLM